MADPRNTLELLHELIETCRDGETGYVHAAAIINDPELKIYFTEQAKERTRLLAELTEEAKRIGESKPDISGSVAGVLHRAWFEAKADLGLGDQAILNSVEMGEDAAKKAYKEALDADLPDQVRALVHRQAPSVFAAHDHVRDLRDRRKAA
jgi:uncharacterized protein (TIGR02284 family)